MNKTKEQYINKINEVLKRLSELEQDKKILINFLQEITCDASDKIENSFEKLDFVKYLYWNVNYKCEICNSKENLCIHHRTYENLGNESNEDLICLCKICHETFHNKLPKEK